MLARPDVVAVVVGDDDFVVVENSK